MSYSKEVKYGYHDYRTDCQGETDRRQLGHVVSLIQVANGYRYA
jgi:hypothetical protein